MEANSKFEIPNSKFEPRLNQGERSPGIRRVW